MSRKRSRKVERHLYVLYAVVDEVSFKVHDLFHLQSTFEIYPAIYEAMKQDVIRKKRSCKCDIIWCHVNGRFNAIDTHNFFQFIKA